MLLQVSGVIGVRRAIRLGVCAVSLALAGTAAGGAGAIASPPAVDEELRAAEAPAVELELDRAVALPGGATLYRYEQEVAGVPVDASVAVVADPVGTPPSLVVDETDAGVEAPGQPAISRARAIDLASASVDVRRLRAAPSASLALVPGGAGSLAWDVSLPALRPLGDFEVLVDAADGGVLATHNLLRRARGRAKLFVPNAVVANRGYAGVANVGRREGKRYPDRDRDTRRLKALRTRVALKHMRRGQGCLRGRWVTAKVGERRKKVCRRSRDWSGVTRHENAFEALMAYHAIDRTQSYIRSLGFDHVNAESQDVIANARMPRAIGQDNSFYTPLGDRIELGTGGVDDGEDQDTIIHEYGHAVQDAQVRGFGRGLQAGSMGEGFGDYLAAAMSAETRLVRKHGRFDPCVMEWDSTSYAAVPSCLRRTDSPITKSQAYARCRDPISGTRDVHCVGEVWSGALWRLRRALGNDGGESIMDQVVLASHFMLPPGASFSQAARALIDADEAIHGAGDHCAAIRAEMVDRGLLPGSFACG
jgi:Fungalysin metallopeptidase (M36)